MLSKNEVEVTKLHIRNHCTTCFGNDEQLMCHFIRWVGKGLYHASDYDGMEDESNATHIQPFESDENIA